MEDVKMELWIFSFKAAQRFPDKRIVWVAHNKDPGKLLKRPSTS